MNSPSISFLRWTVNHLTDIYQILQNRRNDSAYQGRKMDPFLGYKEGIRRQSKKSGRGEPRGYMHKGWKEKPY